MTELQPIKTLGGLIPVVTEDLRAQVESLITDHAVVCKFGTDAAYEKSKADIKAIFHALVLQHGLESVERAVIETPDPNDTMEGL